MSDEYTQDDIEHIARLNDQCRKSVMMPRFGDRPCKVYFTPGIAALTPEDQMIIASGVRDFNDFSEDNNPYGERDFGAFDHKGHKIYWKINYYDLDLRGGSEDPRDPSKTMRVLTILFADEY